MKPKGGAKCSRRSHSLWVKWAPSRKRVRLGRKIFFSHGDLEALIFTESGQVYVREDVSCKGGARKFISQMPSGHHQPEDGLGTISYRLDWALQFESSYSSSLYHAEPRVWLPNSPSMGPQKQSRSVPSQLHLGKSVDTRGMPTILLGQ